MQIVKLQPSQIATSSTSLKDQYSEAVAKSMQLLNDIYEEVAIFTCHWKSDDTGGSADCKEIINTMSRLHGSRDDLVLTHIIDSEADSMDFMLEVGKLKKQLDRKKRTLFIFHYAGHATANSTSNDLILTEINPTTQLGEELEEKYKTSFTPIKQSLIEASSKNPNMDILMVMDCCCAAVAGRGGVHPSGRVEFVAATTPTGIANTRDDSQTFTQAWCTAFQTLFAKSQEFTTDDIIKIVNDDRQLAQFPLLYVNLDGAGIPITFNPSDNTQTVAKRTAGKVMLVAFHIVEDPKDQKTLELVEYLENSVIPAAIVGIYKTDSTLLVVELVELVVKFMRQSLVILWPSSKKLIFENGSFEIVSPNTLVSKILKQNNETLPSQVNVILGPSDSAPVVWDLKYINDEIDTIVWQDASFRRGKVPKDGSDSSIFYWNESQDGKLRRIRLHPDYSRKIIVGEIWCSIEKSKYNEYNVDAGEQIPFRLQ